MGERAWKTGGREQHPEPMSRSPGSFVKIGIKAEKKGRQHSERLIDESRSESYTHLIVIPAVTGTLHVFKLDPVPDIVSRNIPLVHYTSLGNYPFRCDGLGMIVKPPLFLRVR